ncbi:hypothetical protein V2J09_004310 [Rumex salicifolius]
MPSLRLTLFFNLLFVPISASLRNPHPIYDGKLHYSNETCGSLKLPFPFYITKPFSSGCLNTSQYQLLCVNSTALYLSIATQVYRVLHFYSDGILVDFPGLSSICRPYNDLDSFLFLGHTNAYLGISSDNVVGLYDCEDSSLCKADCDLPGCNNIGEIRPLCCYPLSDDTFWSVGDEFSEFRKYECRGFSSWAVPKGMKSGRRGAKLDWAIPKNLSMDACHSNAHIVNSTAVKDGIRCVCDYGFSGDGFKNGAGCYQSCLKDGKGCDTERQGSSKRKIMILADVNCGYAGLLTSVAAVASLAVFILLLKQSYGKQPPNNTCTLKNARRGIRRFSISELEQATNGFSAELKLADLYNGSVYFGLLQDGTRVAVQTVESENENDKDKDLTQFHTQIELLSTIVHRHVARIVGCCVESTGDNPIVVYEFPENGTLADHIGLDWCDRLSVAAETAATLDFLQNEISTPVSHHNLNACCIFLDSAFSAKLACFELMDQHHSISRSDVYDLGVVLLEILSGSRSSELPGVALERIRDGKIEEVVDPLLYYHEQPAFRKEEMVRMADVATRCLLFGGAEQGKLRIGDVARELLRMVRESHSHGIGGGSSMKVPSLEETFSNSSLLQMISMSPDSIYAPPPPRK